MSQHPSLRFDSVGAKHRNVLTRLERMKKLEEQNKWQGRTSAFGLPKVKSLKIKVKKIKEAPAEEGAAAAPAGAAASPAGQAKGAASQAAKAPQGAKPAQAAAPKAEKGKK